MEEGEVLWIGPTCREGGRLAHRVVPKVYDPDMKSIEGVDCQSPVRSSSIAPASMLKVSIQKGYRGGSGPSD